MKKYCSEVISEDDSRRVFQACHRNLGSNLGLSDFKTIFGAVAPKSNFHIQGLKQIRSWMYENGLTSDQAFDSLFGGRQTVSLDQLEQALSRHFRFTSPEVEDIFKAIVQNHSSLSSAPRQDWHQQPTGVAARPGFDSESETKSNQNLPHNSAVITKRKWCETVYEDSANPLQLIREIVNEYNLDEDDLLFRMKLRIWDDPLDYPKFVKAIRSLDTSLTDVQLRALAKSLKNSKNLVEVPVLVNNLIGKDHQTVDFRDKLYKRLFSEILESGGGSKKEKLK